MGCDIHIVAEVKTREDNFWSGYLVEPYIGRNYDFFAVLARVRGEYPESFDPRGFPEDASFESVLNYGLYVFPDDEFKDNLTRVPGWSENALPKSEASELLASGLVREVSDGIVSHPDFHSASYMSLEEFEFCIDVANKHFFKAIFDEAEELGREKPEPGEYFAYARGLAAYLRYFKSLGEDVRVVFWFDS